MKLKALKVGMWCVLLMLAGVRGGEAPRVLLLGDSISIGYTRVVQDELQGVAEVIRPMLPGDKPENCAGTTKGVEAVDRWLQLGTGAWDFIHFNFGLHDLKRVNRETGSNSNDPNDLRQAEPDVYERQLREIVKRLKRTGAALMFATTTPVPVGGVKPHRDVSDPALYNAIARKVCVENGVLVNDLYNLALPRLAEIQRPVNVHFTEAGSALLGKEVARRIREALLTRREP